MVANQDYPLKPAGVAIDVCPGGNCPGGCKFNAVPGEFLLFNMDTRTTIDSTMIATTKRVALAQAVGSNGCASDLKFLFHDNFNFCEHGFDVNIASPLCGQSQILDMYIPNCTATDKTMGFGIWLDDSYVRATMGYNNKLFYNWVVNNYKAGCTNCTDAAVCDELICALVDQINGTYQPDPMKVAHHGLINNLCSRYQPFRAARLYNGVGTTMNWSLTLSGSGCVECAYLPGITGINIGGVPTAFNFTVDPTDNTRSLVSQIDRIVYLINQALKPIGGSAVRLKGLGNCCAHQIQINSCQTNIQLITNAGNVAPTSVADVARTVAAEVICRDCAATPAPVALACGIRLFVDPVEVPCGECGDVWRSINLPPPNTYIRTIQPSLLDAASTDALHVFTVQNPVHPEGFGYYYQHKQRWESNGGPGRDFRYTNAYFGDLQLADAGSRDSHLDVVCLNQYCVYDFTIRYSAVGHHNAALRYHNKNLGRVLIKNTSVTLRPQFEAVLAAFSALGTCNSIDLTCTP